MKNKNSTLRLRAELALLALRIITGIVLMAHGWGKLTGFGAWQEQVASLEIPVPNLAAVLAIAGELLGGAGLVAGLLARIASLGAFAVMLTAIVTVHAGNGLLARNNGFEFPLTLLMITVFFMAHGAGRFSLDAVIQRWRARREKRGRSDAAHSKRRERLITSESAS